LALAKIASPFTSAVPPKFLNRGYIEFELDTVLTAANNGTVFNAAQLNDLIIKIVIAEPDIS
jgi:hypothetical protein